jgi:hypothetical protein
MGHTSVMAGRAATEADDLDYFPTPPWAARAGAEVILRLDPGSWSCWEPAAGGGHMAHGLADSFPLVVESDVFPHRPDLDLFDFAAADSGPAPDWLKRVGEVDWIITNPPFKAGEVFVRRALARARRGVAMLLRLSFLEGGKRYRLLHVDCPLTAVAPFAERVPMVKGRWDPEASSATAYAWFIWRKTPLGGLDASPCTVIPIPPGTRARLTKVSDMERFCGAVTPGLLDGEAPA